MNAKISVFVICVEAIIYLLCNLHTAPLKLEEEYSHLKLWSMCNTSSEFD